MRKNRVESWNRSCLRKKRMSEKIANKVIDRAIKETGTKLRKYYCIHCLGWHVTSKPKIKNNKAQDQ